MDIKNIINTLFEEEEIGILFVWRDYKFSIHSPEGAIPHIHFTKGNSEKPELNGCLKILEKSFFKHGKYKDELPRKVFDNIFLPWIQQDKNFKLVCKEWNENNSITKINDKVKNPYL